MSTIIQSNIDIARIHATSIRDSFLRETLLLLLRSDKHEMRTHKIGQRVKESYEKQIVKFLKQQNLDYELTGTGLTQKIKIIF